MAPSFSALRPATTGHNPASTASVATSRPVYPVAP